jgi:replication factor A1
MDQVEPGTRVTMHVRVHSVKIIRQRQRYDGEELNQVAECLVGDATGCCKMISTDSQLEVVKEGAVITIRNAHANVVKEHLRIEVDRWAKVEASTEKVAEKVNTTKNLSDVEYELVSVKV